MTALQTDFDAETAAGLRLVEHPADKLPRLARHYDGKSFLGAVKSGELPVPPMGNVLGFEIREIADGTVTFAYSPSLEHYNAAGVVHGGLAAALLDTAMGCAVQTLLPKESTISTLDVNVRYVRPMTVRTGRVFATATTTHRGRRTATAEGRIVEATTGRLLATATTTVFIQP